MPTFSQDFTADFDQAVAGLLPGYSGEPYAIARFGDGEGAIVFGERHEAKSDGWQWNGGVELGLANRLFEAVRCTLPGWHIGLPAAEHESIWHERLLGILEGQSVPPDRVTFAEIFCFANYRRFMRLDLSNVFKVGHGDGCDWVTPKTPQDEDWPDSIRSGVGWIVNHVHRPIIVSAGPWGKVFIHEYWKAAAGSPNRQTIIDVGSALSPSLLGKKTRRYHNRRSPQFNWKPRWTL